MAAEFDTQPDYTSDEDRPPQPAPEHPERSRGIWGALALLVLAALFLFLLSVLSLARVPSLQGLSRAAAEARLAEAGFTVGDVSEVPVGSGKPGSVTGQAPTAGATVRKGTSVDLMVALGSDLATVPDVVGHNAASASVEVQQAGFQISNAEEYSDTVPLGVVVSQTPRGESQAAVGTAVIASYSLGPQSAADVAVSRSDSNDGLTADDRGTTGSGTDPLIMNCVDAYPGASTWSSDGDIYVRLSPGGSARRVTSTGDWDSAPVISPSHKYLVFLRASGSGNRATGVGAVCFTTFATRRLPLTVSSSTGDRPVYYGRPIFAPSENSTRADTDWIVVPQYWLEKDWTGQLLRRARLMVCNVPMGSSWASRHLQFRSAARISLSRSSTAGCVRVKRMVGSKSVYSRDFNTTTGLYSR